MAPAHARQRIALAVDAVIFTVIRDALHVLLIQMKKPPYAGRWAFPGGLINHQETTEAAARRVLRAQTGLKDVYLEQLATFDDPKRDRLGRVVSVAYLALVSSADVELKTTDRYAAVAWRPVADVPRLAYDHTAVARVALERLRSKLEYTNVAWSLLPAEFTLTDLQHLYEVIMDRPVDKRNFRKKLLAFRVVIRAGRKQKGENHRPAELYRFRERRPVRVDML